MFKEILVVIGIFLCGGITTALGILLSGLRNRSSDRRVKEGIRDSKTTVGEMGKTVSDIKRETQSIGDTVEQLKQSDSDLRKTKDDFRDSTDRFGKILSEIERKRHDAKD